MFETKLLPCLLIALAGSAEAGVISTLDFNSLPAGNVVFAADQAYIFDLRERTLTSTPWGDFVSIAGIGGGNQALVDSDISNAFGAGVFLHRADNQPFDLLSLDVANLNGSSGSGNIQVSIQPYTATQDFAPASAAFMAVNPMGFTNVPYLFFNLRSFSGANFSIDKIVVNIASPVPEPSSLALLGLGLLMAGAAYRRR